MYTLSDVQLASVGEWEHSEAILRGLSSPSADRYDVDPALVTVALRVLRRTAASFQPESAHRDGLDVRLSEESLRTHEIPATDAWPDWRTHLLLANWAESLALTDESALHGAATIASRLPWYSWLLPATWRWVYRMSSADYFHRVSKPVHSFALGQIAAVEQDGCELAYLERLTSEYRERIERAR